MTPRFCVGLLLVAALTAGATFSAAALYGAIVAAAALLAFLAADAAVQRSHDYLTVTREPPDRFALRSRGELRYNVRNSGRIALRYGIIETPVDVLELAEDALIGSIGPGRGKLCRLPVRPIERGFAKLGPFYVWAQTAIGLVRRRWIFEDGREIHVYPDLSAVERYGKLGRRGRFIELGLRRLRLHGGAGEFDSLREWVPDDEFRSIDWKATARRARLMVAEHNVERRQNVVLLLDAGRLMTPRIGEQRKFDFVLTATLSVAAIAGLADDNVGLMAFARNVLEDIPARSGRRHAAALTRRVYDLQPRFEEADYEAAFAALQRRHSKRSLVVFFSDMFDPIASAGVLANLSVLSARHLVVCVLMNDEAIESALGAEINFPFDAYRASVACALLSERRKATAMLKQRGAIVIDVPAARLSVSVIDAYLEVKSRGLL